VSDGSGGACRAQGSKRPSARFLFLGPTGSQDELARPGEFLFDDDTAMVRLA